MCSSTKALAGSNNATAECSSNTASSGLRSRKAEKKKKALRAELSELRPQYEEALRFGSLDRAKVINARMEALEEKDRFLANLIVKSVQPFKSVAAELGLTPSSRSRVIALNGADTPKNQEDSELFSKEAMQKCLEFGLDYGGMN